VPTYRTLLSVQIEADSDAEAVERADEFAMALRVGHVVVGHLELGLDAEALQAI